MHRFSVASAKRELLASASFGVEALLLPRHLRRESRQVPAHDYVRVTCAHRYAHMLNVHGYIC